MPDSYLIRQDEYILRRSEDYVYDRYGKWVGRRVQFTARGNLYHKHGTYANVFEEMIKRIARHKSIRSEQYRKWIDRFMDNYGVVDTSRACRKAINERLGDGESNGICKMILHPDDDYALSPQENEDWYSKYRMESFAECPCCGEPQYKYEARLRYIDEETYDEIPAELVESKKFFGKKIRKTWDYDEVERSKNYTPLTSWDARRGLYKGREGAYWIRRAKHAFCDKEFCQKIKGEIGTDKGSRKALQLGRMDLAAQYRILRTLKRGGIYDPERLSRLEGCAV